MIALLRLNLRFNGEREFTVIEKLKTYNVANLTHDERMNCEKTIAREWSRSSRSEARKFI